MEFTKEMREELVSAFDKNDMVELEEINASLFQKDEYINIEDDDIDLDDIDLEEYEDLGDGEYRYKGFSKQQEIIEKILQDLDRLDNWIAAGVYGDDGSAGVGLVYLNGDYSIKWNESKKANLKQKIQMMGAADVWLSTEEEDYLLETYYLLDKPEYEEEY